MSWFGDALTYVLGPSDQAQAPPPSPTQTGQLLGSPANTSLLGPIPSFQQYANDLSSTRGVLAGMLSKGIGPGLAQAIQPDSFAWPGYTQTADVAQQMQQRQLANIGALSKMSYLAQRHPEMFPSGLLQQAGSAVGVPMGGGEQQPGGILGGAPAQMPMSQNPALRAPPDMLMGQGAPAQQKFDPEDAALTWQFMGLDPKLNPQLAGAVKGAEAQASAPYDIIKAFASQAGRGISVDPTHQAMTGLDVVDPRVKEALIRMVGASGGSAALPTGPASAGASPQAAPAPTSAPLPAPMPRTGGGGGTASDGTGFPVRSTYAPGGGRQAAMSPQGQTMATKVLPAQFEEAQKQYQNAQGMQGQLDYIDHALDDLNQAGWSSTGEGANRKMGVFKGINSLQTSLGMQPSFDPAKIGTWEDFNKESTRMGFELAKTLGSREAMMIVQQAVAAVPNSENSYLGGKLVSSALRMASQRQMDYYEFLQKYATDHGGSTWGADVAFNKQHPVGEYTKAAIAQAKQTAGDLPPGASGKQSVDQTTLANFKNAVMKGGNVAGMLAKLKREGYDTRELEATFGGAGPRGR